MQKFKVLNDWDLVEQGRFKEAMNEALDDIQQAIIKHVMTYGKDGAKGAKAQVRATITVQFEGPDITDFVIKGNLERKVPARPIIETYATSDRQDDGRPALFVKASGSSYDDPHQQVICTDTGDAIDVDTGEVLEEGV